MRHLSLCLVAILTFMPLASATAQVPIRQGARVRVTRLPICPPTCVGGPPRQDVVTFVTWSGDTLLAQSNGNTIVLPLDAVTKLEVSQGQKSHTGVGAVIGFLVGGAAGAAIGYASYSCEGWSCLGYGPWPSAGVGLAIGGVGGLVAGALIGSAIKTDRWEEVPLDRVRVSLGPQRDGRFGFGASVRF
jgi:hypothetical protein